MKSLCSSLTTLLAHLLGKIDFLLAVLRLPSGRLLWLAQSSKKNTDFAKQMCERGC